MLAIEISGMPPRFEERRKKRREREREKEDFRKSTVVGI